MAPTKIIGYGDRTEFDQANVDELQASLDRLTANVDRWNQGNYCTVNNDGEGVDPLTDDHLEAGTYHDFELSAELIAELRAKRGTGRRNYAEHMLPIADCGTAFCVAGDVAVHNGYTFVALPHEQTTYRVVPTSSVPRVFTTPDPFDIDMRDASVVAREVLNISSSDASRLFSSGNSLFTIWALGYGLTGGRLKLPESLPHANNGDSHMITPALDTAQDVRDAIMLTMLTYETHTSLWRRMLPIIDLDRTRELLATVDADEMREKFRVPVGYAKSCLKQADEVLEREG
jgi:hypothetical protein